MTVNDLYVSGRCVLYSASSRLNSCDCGNNRPDYSRTIIEDSWLREQQGVLFATVRGLVSVRPSQWFHDMCPLEAADITSAENFAITSWSWFHGLAMAGSWKCQSKNHFTFYLVPPSMWQIEKAFFRPREQPPLFGKERNSLWMETFLFQIHRAYGNEVGG